MFNQMCGSSLTVELVYLGLPVITSANNTCLLNNKYSVSLPSLGFNQWFLGSVACVSPSPVATELNPTLFH